MEIIFRSDKNEKKNNPIIDFNKYYKNDDGFDLSRKYKEEELNKNTFYYRKDFSVLYGDIIYIDNDVKKLNDIITIEENLKGVKMSAEAKSIVIDMVKYFNKKNDLV